MASKKNKKDDQHKLNVKGLDTGCFSWGCFKFCRGMGLMLGG